MKEIDLCLGTRSPLWASSRDTFLSSPQIMASSSSDTRSRWTNAVSSSYPASSQADVPIRRLSHLLIRPAAEPPLKHYHKNQCLLPSRRSRQMDSTNYPRVAERKARSDLMRSVQKRACRRCTKTRSTRANHLATSRKSGLRVSTPVCSVPRFYPLCCYKLCYMLTTYHRCWWWLSTQPHASCTRTYPSSMDDPRDFQMQHRDHL